MSVTEERRWLHQGGTSSVTLPLDAELLAEAKAMNIDLPQVLEEALRQKMQLPQTNAQKEEPAVATGGW